MDEQNKAVRDCVDETIKQVCENIQENDLLIEDYLETVKALALLVQARASLK